MMEYGLALAGGGTRGAAHAGVLLALEEEKMLPSAIGGTSAGSLAAGLFACGMAPAQICEAVHELAAHGMEYLDPDIFGLLRMIAQLLAGKKTSLSGILKGKKLRDYFIYLTGGIRLEKLTTPLLIPAVDLLSGDTVCFTNLKPNGKALSGKTGAAGADPQIRWVNTGQVGEIMMASSSVPGVFRPVEMAPYLLVDGGVTNNLPVDLMRAAGISRIVAVDIGSDYEMPEHDCVFEILSHSFSIMSSSLKDCRSMGECLLLRPELTKKAGLLTFEYMEDCMEAAYRYTRENAPRIRKELC